MDWMEGKLERRHILQLSTRTTAHYSPYTHNSLTDHTQLNVSYQVTNNHDSENCPSCAVANVPSNARFRLVSNMAILVVDASGRRDREVRRCEGYSDGMCISTEHTHSWCPKSRFPEIISEDDMSYNKSIPSSDRVQQRGKDTKSWQAA